MVQSRKKLSVKKKFYLATWKQVLLGLFVLACVLVFSALFILEVAIRPFETASEHAKKIATEYADLQTISHVTKYNGAETFYAVWGTDEQTKDMIVLVPKSSETIYLFDPSEKLSKEQAEIIAQENGANEIHKTVLGVREERIIWEVHDGTAYYLIDVETEELVKKEGL